jgi:hypothetical protein
MHRVGGLLLIKALKEWLLATTMLFVVFFLRIGIGPASDRAMDVVLVVMAVGNAGNLPVGLLAHDS